MYMRLSAYNGHYCYTTNLVGLKHPCEHSNLLTGIKNALFPTGNRETAVTPQSKSVHHKITKGQNNINY